MTNYYVYVYCTPLKPSPLLACGFEPFYVGKGQRGREAYHMSQKCLSSDPNKHKVSTIKKILEAGASPIIVRVFESLSEDQAFDKEKEYIAKFGRADKNKGPLTNLTDGGDGPSGKIVSIETRSRLSASSKNAFLEGRSSVSQEWIIAGHKSSQTKEAIAKSAKSRTGMKRSVETKAKLSLKRKEFVESMSAEERKKVLGTMTGKKHPFSKTGGVNPTAKQVEVLGETYQSLTAAVAATGIHKKKLRKDPTFRIIG